MNSRVSEQRHFDSATKRGPFSSLSSYLTLILCSLLPVGLWITQGWFLDTLEDFDIEVSRLTILFLSPLMPILASSLPIAVAAKEFLVESQHLRSRCDLVLTILGLVSLFVAWMAIGVPMWNLVDGLRG